MLEETRPEKLEAFKQAMARHLIAFGGTYVPIDENMKPGEEKFFCYTGTVISVNGDWWLITAGHVFDDIERMLERRQIAITGTALADYFSADTQYTSWPFDFAGARKVWKYEDGVDFAALPISSYYVTLLRSARILPFTEDAWIIDKEINFYQYRLLGIPAHNVKQNRIASSEPITGYVKPLLLCLDREADDTRYANARFTGRVGDDVPSVVGMSGGAIIGLAMHKGEHIYRLMAIQSSWDSASRMCFGCPVSAFVPVAQRMLAEGNGKSEKQPQRP